MDIQFVYNSEYWTNKIYVQASNDTAAAQDALDIGNYLATAVQNAVTVQKVRVTPMPAVANQFFDVPVNAPGSGGTTAPAPLFNVVRWVFSPARGRSTMHYFRGGITAANFGPDGNFTDAAAIYNSSVVRGLFDLPQVIVDKYGHPYISANAARKVGMHQLRRGSKRVKKPVI